MELVSKLQMRERDGKPVSVGVIGCGQMGSGLAHAVAQVTGMRVNAIADLDVGRAIDTLISLGCDRSDIVETNDPDTAEDALRHLKRLVTQDALLLTKLDSIEANVEATGATDIGARVAYDSIMRHKPIIMLNVETDITVGWYLNRLARTYGSLYTVASGDEPGVCKMLYEQALLMGFDVVTLGKGKNNTINHEATADLVQEEAVSKGMNPKMLAAFQDGTKTMVEMAAVSNATGLIPDVPGMHGPFVPAEDLINVFIPKSDGGIFSGPGRVDYSTGPIAPGVFAVVHTEDKRMRKEMKFITRADGPYYLHFRPYHLCDLETPQSIAEAVLLNEVTVTADDLHAEVVCKAKRDIRSGETLGGIGGDHWYGQILTHAEAVRRKAVPIGIGFKAVAVRDIKKGALITEADVTLDDSTFIYRLRRMQDALYSGGTT
jgi:predicted homoserine dehydrogenase-like protein